MSLQRILTGAFVGALDGVLAYHNQPSFAGHPFVGFCLGVYSMSLAALDHGKLSVLEDKYNEADMYLHRRPEDFDLSDGRRFSELTSVERSRYLLKKQISKDIHQARVMRYDWEKEFVRPVSVAAISFGISYAITSAVDKFT